MSSRSHVPARTPAPTAARSSAATGQVTENQCFTSPLFRIRHMYVKAETDAVDILLGQYWDLFGWQSGYHPNTVEIQGDGASMQDGD